jgi:flavin-dependent dehydrogenase
VCGEFISGRGQEVLERLGLRTVLERAGAVRANTAAFFLRTKSVTSRPLPASAICLSRFEMDMALAEEFRRLGGELLENKRWREREFGEGIVRATGRRSHTEEKGCHWFGLKVHAHRAQGMAQAADLELHVTRTGYLGLCRINGGAINVCGLFRRHAGTEQMQRGREMLRGEPGSVLHERLAGAEFDEGSFCAVAALSLQPRRASARSEFCLGDSITLIPPLTGNGMSMALESAEMAVDPVIAWSRNKLTWPEAQKNFTSRCDAAFRRRLAWAKWVQQIALSRVLQGVLVSMMSRSEWLWRSAFERTR